MVFAFKVAGACAKAGGSLDEVERMTRHALAHTRTMGVALGPCTVPASGIPTFTIGDDEMEIGMGIHGERGVRRGKLEPADAIADRLLDAVAAELDLRSGSRVAVMVNGLGATPLEELYILYRRVHQRLAQRGVAVYRPYVGEFATSMEMVGASLTVMQLDNTLIPLLDAPAESPFFVQGAR